MSVTHEQIAQELGISRTIVTQALNGTRSSRVSPETRMEVQRVARELGYRPRNVTTHAIGCIISTAQFQTEPDLLFVIEVERALRERGYRMTVVNPESVQDGTDGALSDMLNARTIDGLLLTSWEKGRYRHLIGPELPCVLLSEEDDADINVDQVGADLLASIRVCLREFREAGHERLAFVMGNNADGFSRRLAQAIDEATREDVWAPGTVEIFRWDRRDFGAALLDRLDQESAPTCFLFSDVEKTILAYSRFLEAGLKAPRDLSIMSLFDSPMCRKWTPGISSTSVGGKEAAERGVEALLRKLKGHTEPVQRVLVPGMLISRQSVGKPKGN